METKRTLSYILLIVSSIIIVYNYIIFPIQPYNYAKMNMGMHRGMGMHNYSAHSNDFRYIAAILIIMAVLILFYYLKYSNQAGKCRQCGYAVDNSRWRICPICGTYLKQRKDEA